MNRSFNEEHVNNLLRLYLVDDEKEEVRQDIETIVNMQIPKLLFSKKPSLSAPSEEKCLGDISLGKIVQGDVESEMFYVTLEDLQRHVAVFASTGSGKTTFIVNIEEQLMELPDPIYFTYFDFKQDLRHIKDSRAKVLRYDWLKLNPL